MGFSVAIEKLVGGGRSGFVQITDVAGQGAVVISDKVWQDATNTILQTCTASGGDLTISIRASGASVTVNGTPAILTADGDDFIGDVNVIIAASGDVEVILMTPDDEEGAVDTCTVTIVAAPEILTLSFTGGYPGSQTQLKAGDTFQITGTTDVNADAIDILDFGAFDASLETFAEGTSFTVTGTIADRGTSTQALAGRVRARSAVGAFGSTRDTNELGGSVDGVDLVNLNNTLPSFVDNGTTFPLTQQAFKGTEASSQDTTVSDYDTLLYSSPHGDFSIGSPTIYVQDKPIICTNPGDYNDSTTNFRITANRAANDATAIFDKTIEVADVAPTITVTQPAVRLRSGGNDGTSAQDHVITATSDQNMAAAPDISIPVDGTWLGGAFLGGPKIFTRTIQIHDDDAKGSAAWTQAGPVYNNAGIAANITGDQDNGGFVARDVTFPAFAQTVNINVAVTTYAKLTAGIFTATGNASNLNPAQGNHSDIVDTYTVDSIGTNPTPVWWNDVTAAGGNATGTAQLLALEETV